MQTLLFAMGFLLASGVLALVAGRSARWSTVLGSGGAVIGCVIGFVPVLMHFAQGAAPERLDMSWDIPYASFSLELDALSAFFALPILGASALAAVYGSHYLWHYRDHHSLGPPWFFFNGLVASMLMVVLARNAVLFLIAWEAMSLASFFLVTFEDEKPSVREAGRTYLIATHIGTAFLLGFFVLLGQGADRLDFGALGRQGTLSAGTGNILFLLAVVGFGTKAGLIPFHVWLPEAHPAAPSHISAVMSGVMVKTGIYGILRAIMLLPAVPMWWGWLLIGLGLLSGVWGILFASAQSDLKRLLAYSTVENVGVITMGIGTALVGASAHSPIVVILGFSGALLHVLNHSVFKSLLFLGAGAILHATGTRDLDRLGGLLKRMPLLGGSFLCGVVAIAGLPPFNGFVSEFLIYLAAFRGDMFLRTDSAVPGLAVIAALAFIGGLAAVCFTKVFGIAFLGEPRTEQASNATKPSLFLTIPIVVLAAGCLLLGLAAPMLARLITPLAAALGQLDLTTVGALAEEAVAPLPAVTLMGLGLLGLAAALAALRRGLLAGRSVGATGTWDCGYARPTARMQYTASSYVQPITACFASLLKTREERLAPRGLFPAASSLATTTPDLCKENFYGPIFQQIGRSASKLRWIQLGNVHVYILYIAITILSLLFWYLSGSGAGMGR